MKKHTNIEQLLTTSPSRIVRLNIEEGQRINPLEIGEKELNETVLKEWMENHMKAVILVRGKEFTALEKTKLEEALLLMYQEFGYKELKRIKTLISILEFEFMQGHTGLFDLLEFYRLFEN